MFILGKERHGSYEEMAANFRRYGQYLEDNRHVFPPNAWSLATSDWYLNPQDHKCPHDAWLEECVLSEPSSGENMAERYLSMRVRLLGAYHDGFTELHYPIVYGYQLLIDNATHGFGDRRYDEFRINERGQLVHEIEWITGYETPRWIITANDVQYSWHPING